MPLSLCLILRDKQGPLRFFKKIQFTQNPHREGNAYEIGAALYGRLTSHSAMQAAGRLHSTSKAAPLEDAIASCNLQPTGKLPTQSVMNDVPDGYAHKDAL